MRYTVEKLARARNCVARAEALVRRQARMVEHLASDRDAELVATGQLMLVTFSGLAEVMRAHLRRVNGGFSRGR
jgi:hypothetical protein